MSNNINQLLMSAEQIKKIKTHSFNPKLKQPFQSFQYTELQLQEYINCKNDILYFANNYFYNVTLDGGLSKIQPYDFQLDVLKSMQDDRFIVINASRQIGKSMMYSIFVCWYLIFHDYKKIAILANKANTVKGILNEKIKVAYEQLPLFLQQGVSVWNVNSFELENHSSVSVYATTPDSVRSISCNILIIDEAGIIRDNLWNEFAQSSFPVISAGRTTKMFICSTPKGYNHFYDLFTKATLKKNNFKAFEFKWDVVPTRDEKWKEGEIALHGEDYFLQEYCAEFIGASGTLIRGMILKKIITDISNNDYILDISDKEKYKKFSKLLNYIKNIRIFKEPIEDHNYMVSLDSATNTDSEDGDSASIQILDVSKLPFEQVACADFIDDTSYLEIPYVEVALAKIYNNAWIFNENNDGAGRETNLIIKNEIGYEYLYTAPTEKIAGYRTTTLTKSRGCTNLKNLIEHGYLIIKDKTTMSQLSQFGRVRDSYKAINGYDDNVLSLIGTIYFLQLSQEELDNIFYERYCTLPIITDLLKIIYTTINETINDDILVKEDGNIEFKNELLNVGEENNMSINQMIENFEEDFDLIARRLEKKNMFVQTIVGAEYNKESYDNDDVLFGMEEDGTFNKKKKMTVDDLIFDE